jgi:hypothetical protein
LPIYTAYFGDNFGDKMKTKIKKGKANGKHCYILDISYKEKRYRKYFTNYPDADKFDVLRFLSQKQETEPVGDDTMLNVARDEYLHAYDKKNKNKFKPKQKGYETTQDRVNRFLKFVGNKKVSEVTKSDYQNYLDSQRWSLKTKQGYGSAVRMFMAWCGKKNLGAIENDWYIKSNEDLRVGESEKSFKKLPEILSIEETKALLGVMPEQYKPAMAITLFTGIRPEIEMDTLDYSHIQHGKRIGLRAEFTKTGRERWIIPPQNLWAWLPKVKSGKVMPSYSGFMQARRRAARRAYGWKNNGRRGGGGVNGFNYPSNGARHSFGSYGYWHLGFESALDIMGHMHSETFLRNYKNNRVDKEESDLYFSIAPKKKKKESL